MVVALAGGADGAHLKEKFLPVEIQPGVILGVRRSHKDNFGSEIGIVNKAKIPGGKLGEGPVIYKNIVLMPLTSLYPKVSGPGKFFVKVAENFLDAGKYMNIIISKYYEVRIFARALGKSGPLPPDHGPSHPAADH
jgi:hypothetical protein